MVPKSSFNCLIIHLLIQGFDEELKDNQKTKERPFLPLSCLCNNPKQNVTETGWPNNGKTKSYEIFIRDFNFNWLILIWVPYPSKSHEFKVKTREFCDATVGCFNCNWRFGCWDRVNQVIMYWLNLVTLLDLLKIFYFHGFEENYPWHGQFL